MQTSCLYKGSGAAWYYCQKSYGTLQGVNGTSINMLYGCLLTDVAMVATKETGNRYTPPMVASMTQFSRNTLQTFPSIGNLHPDDIWRGGIQAINEQLRLGHPVIVYLHTNTMQHWVVFYQQLANGDYLMNDPWYGSSLPFLGDGNGTHRTYTLSDIQDAFILQ